ncbi:MAG: hypothetical protein J6K58_16040 [Lachnospiraceae bacterium]|nr:hypothetical protein [Lachnospiraceae bacterium]
MDFKVLSEIFKGVSDLKKSKREQKENGYSEQLFERLEQDIIKRSRVLNAGNSGSISDYQFYYAAVTKKMIKYIEAGRFEDALNTFERVSWDDFLQNLNRPGMSTNNMNHMWHIAYGMMLYLWKGDVEAASQIYGDTPRHFQYFRKHSDIGHREAVFAEAYLFYKTGDYEQAASSMKCLKKKHDSLSLALIRILEGKLDERLNGGQQAERYYDEARKMCAFPAVERMITEL